MPMQLEDLDLLEPANGAEPVAATPSTSAASAKGAGAGAGAGAGTPLRIPIDTIDEDPDQPRKEFDAPALQELADSIAERGVLQAISVRPHPTQPQRWMVNFGARRLRASKLVGKPDIPAFVDPTADRYDQVIENEQREGLKPLELALFVQQRIGLGETQTEIARRMGKSQAYVAFASALSDAPDWLMDLYRQGRCNGLTELYHLRRLHAQAPERVQAWASRRREGITRTDILALKQELATPVTDLPSRCEPVLDQPSVVDDAAAVLRQQGSEPASAKTSDAASATARAESARPARAAPGMYCLGLFARKGSDVLEIVLDEAPDGSGEVFVRQEQGGASMRVLAAELELIGFRRVTHG